MKSLLQILSITLIPFIYLYIAYIRGKISNQKSKNTKRLLTRSGFYILLVIITLILISVSLDYVRSSAVGQEQCVSCGAVDGIIFIISLIYFLVINVTLIIGFESNNLKNKSFIISLFLAITIMPALYGGFWLYSYLSDMPHARTLYMENQARKYIVKDDIHGCADYIDNYIKKSKSIDMNMIDYLSSDSNHSAEWCTNELVDYKYKLKLRESR